MSMVLQAVFAKFSLGTVFEWLDFDECSRFRTSCLNLSAIAEKSSNRGIPQVARAADRRSQWLLRAPFSSRELLIGIWPTLGQNLQADRPKKNLMTERSEGLAITPERDTDIEPLMTAPPNSGPAPTSDATTITRASGNATVGQMIEFEVFGADISSGVAAAIVQHVTATGGSTTASVAFAAAANAKNRPIAFVAHLDASNTTPRAGWTEPSLSDTNVATPGTAIEGQYREDAFDTAASATFSGAFTWRIFALEIKAL